MTHLTEGSTSSYEEKKGQRGHNGPQVSQGYVGTENGVGRGNKVKTDVYLYLSICLSVCVCLSTHLPIHLPFCLLISWEKRDWAE